MYLAILAGIRMGRSNVRILPVYGWCHKTFLKTLLCDSNKHFLLFYFPIFIVQ